MNCIRAVAPAKTNIVRVKKKKKKKKDLGKGVSLDLDPFLFPTETLLHAQQAEAAARRVDAEQNCSFQQWGSPKTA